MTEHDPGGTPQNREAWWSTKTTTKIFDIMFDQLRFRPIEDVLAAPCDLKEPPRRR